MKKQLKVYVVGRSTGYANWVTNELVNNMEEADLVLLTGGEDVNPKYYNEPKHPTTHFTERDVSEFQEIEQAIKLKIPLLGICRGLQILTVAAGGKLIQDQSNKYSPHLVHNTLNRELEDLPPELNSLYKLKIYENLLFSNIVNSPTDLEYLLGTMLKKCPMITSSAHHQAAYPYNLKNLSDYFILTYTRGLHFRHKNGFDQEVDLPEEVEIESLFLPKINAFGIQGHPEWMLSELQNNVKNLKNCVLEILESYYKINHINKVHMKAFLRSEFLENNSFKEIFIETLVYFNSYLLFLSSLQVITNKKTIGSLQLANSLKEFVKIFYLLKTITFTKFNTIETCLNFLSVENLDKEVETLLLDLINDYNITINNKLNIKNTKNLKDSISSKPVFDPSIFLSPQQYLQQFKEAGNNMVEIGQIGNIAEEIELGNTEQPDIF